MADDFMTGFLAGQDGDKGDMWGGGGIWIILILIVLFGGNMFGGRNGAPAATQADLCQGFNFNNLENGVSRLGQGICDSTYALNTSIMNGFHGVDNALCSTNRNIDGLRYEMSKGFCDVVQAGHADADRILAYLTQDKIQTLQTELQSAQLQLSNGAQTKAIVDQLRPCPIPAYVTCNPWASQPYNGCGCGV